MPFYVLCCQVPGTEVCDCQGVKNVVEAKLVCELTKTLLEVGVFEF